MRSIIKIFVLGTHVHFSMELPTLFEMPFVWDEEIPFLNNYVYGLSATTILIRRSLFKFLNLICQVFSVPSITALSIWHIELLRHGWMYLLCQYGALSLTRGSSYFTWVIWLLMCLNSSSEFRLLPMQYFSTCPKYILELKLVSAIFPFFTKW